MNELGVLMTLLSRVDEHRTRGATEEELQKALALHDTARAQRLHHLLAQLQEYLRVLGLGVRYNPLDEHWFVAHASAGAERLSLNPFGDKKRLGATLLALVMVVFAEGNDVPLSRLQAVRQKKSLAGDLRELEALGYLTLAPADDTIVHLTPLIGYHCDLHRLLRDVERDMLENERETADE